jgi:hypothetical protein
MNPYTPKVLELTEANIDIQFVLDPYATAAYVVSYMMKSQKGMSKLMESACREARRGDKNVVQILRHMGNAFIRALEISAQEVVYLTLDLKLQNSSHQLVFIPSSAPAYQTFNARKR